MLHPRAAVAVRVAYCPTRACKLPPHEASTAIAHDPAARHTEALRQAP